MQSVTAYMQLTELVDRMIETVITAFSTALLLRDERSVEKTRYASLVNPQPFHDGGLAACAKRRRRRVMGLPTPHSALQLRNGKDRSSAKNNWNLVKSWRHRHSSCSLTMLPLPNAQFSARSSYIYSDCHRQRASSSAIH